MGSVNGVPLTPHTATLPYGRKICWKGKILVVKTMYMGIGIQDIGGTKIVCIREMDMDG